MQLSHDTQLLPDSGSSQTSRAGLARLLAVPESAGSMNRLGGRLARDPSAGSGSSSTLRVAIEVCRLVVASPPMPIPHSS